MKNDFNKKIFMFILLTIFLPLFSLACEPDLPLQVENRTYMALDIYVQEHKAGSLEPNSSAKIKGIPGTLSYYLIEAKNVEGKVVYSRKFSANELHDADWKVVITTSIKAPETSDNVT